MMSSFDWNRFKTCSKSEGKQLLEEIKITYGTDDYAELCNQFRYIKETVIDPLNEILIDKSEFELEAARKRRTDPFYVYLKTDSDGSKFILKEELEGKPVIYASFDDECLEDHYYNGIASISHSGFEAVPLLWDEFAALMTANGDNTDIAFFNGKWICMYYAPYKLLEEELPF